MTAIPCARCGSSFDPADRPQCSAMPDRRCTAGDGQTVGLGLEPAGPAATEPAELPAELAESSPAAPGGPESDRIPVTDAPEPAEPSANPPGSPLESSPAGDGAPAEPAPGDHTEPTEPPAAPRNSGRRSHAGETRAPARAYDWPAIRKHYVEGIKADDTVTWPSLDATADHFGVPASRVREKAAKDVPPWTAQRTAWQAQVEETRRRARANALAKQGLDIENRALEAAKTGLQLCNALLMDITNRATQARAAGQRMAAIDALEQQRLAAAVDLWHKIGLRAIGDPEVQRIEVTGAGGGRIEISQELRRDDPSRLAGVLAVLDAAGVGGLIGASTVDDAERTIAAHRGDDGVYSTS